MSEIQLISPLLDNYDVGGSISEHNGVSCYPAMKKDTPDRYIIKKVSIPASQTQLDALLLTGAYPDAASALSYFEDQANSTVAELEILKQLSAAEGFLSYENWQLCPKEDTAGFDVYMIGTYKYSLRKYLQHKPVTHLNAVNLGLDICAALAECRKAGYIMVDLKPNNIFVENDQRFRIGDIGFFALDSLKYATMPDKYSSAYTAPEALDVLSSLNSTLDIYSIGLILYQAYNGGNLPFNTPFPPAEKFDPPAFADYEMAEIILKACDPEPEARWQDPTELRQALISYMQRNGANDTPIVPPVIQLADEIEEAINEVIIPDEATSPVDLESSDSETAPAVDLSDIDLDEILELSADNTESNTQAQEDESPSVDPDEDLSFLDDLITDETAPQNNVEHVAYSEVSDELSEILSQADELVDHAIPDPAQIVASDELDIIELINEIAEDVETESQEDSLECPPEETGDTDDVSEDVDVDSIVNEVSSVVGVVEEEDSSSNSETDDEVTEEDNEDEDEGEDNTKRAGKKRLVTWLLTIAIFLLIAAISAVAIFYYKNIYLLPIDNITVNGSESSMLVQVDTDIDQSILSVVCSDSHGNQISAPVVKGAATFTNLAPDTAYTVRVQVDGFHRLTGETAATYSTPAQTNIVQFSAVTGKESGSMILSFTVEGPDTGDWKVLIEAEGEENQMVEALSNMVTLSGLTVGKEYTFTLMPGEDMYVAGTTQITYTASDLVFAKNVHITSCVDGKLNVVWEAPDDISVPNWTVHCYDDGEYNQTMITAETSAIFENVDPTHTYTVEVAAAGQSVTERAFMAANAITVTNFSADTSAADVLNLTWETSQSVPADGWVLLYTVDGTDIQNSVACTDNSAQIQPVVPNATYTFRLQQADGTQALSEPMTCVSAQAQDFSGYGMTRATMSFQLCKRPEGESWVWSSVEDSDYTSSFAAGQAIAMVGQLHGRYSVSTDPITSLFVIRDAEGKLVTYSHTTRTWKDMWELSYSEMDIPSVPTEPGAYSLTVYFNGCHVTQKDFTIN